MEELKSYKFLRENNITIMELEKRSGFTHEFICKVLRKKRAASPRMIRSLIAATNNGLDESDFIVSKYGK